MNTSCKIFFEDSTDDSFKMVVSFQGHTRTWLSFDNVKEHVHIVPTAEY